MRESESLPNRPMMHTMSPLRRLLSPFLTNTRRRLRRLASAALLVLCLPLLATQLAGCGDRGRAADPPTNVTVTPGDGQLTVAWTGDPSADWWVFYGPDPAMNLGNWTSIAGSRALQNVASPRVVTGLTNGTQYTVIVNGRYDGGKGGPGSAPIFATPRAAGAAWSVGATVPVTVNAIARTASLYVAVGNGGALYTSPDAVTWTPQASNTGADLLAVFYNSGSARLFAVGAGGVALTSANAVDWAVLTTGTSATLRGLCGYGNGILAVGDNGYLGLYDGGAWISRSLGVDRSFSGIANRGNTLFVAAGAGGALRVSTDLSTWSAAASPVTRDLTAIAVSSSATATQFAAVGQGGALVTSSDGVNWTAPAPVVTADLKGLVRGSRFVGVGTGGTVVLSDDGANWSIVSSGTVADLNAVTFGDGSYVAAGAGGVTVSAR